MPFSGKQETFGIKTKLICFLINPIPHGGGGGGGADSTLYQIVFLITSVRDAAELRNLLTFLKI